MKRIISFSLWGNADKYNTGALINIEEAKIVYPGWTCRFYVQENTPAIAALQNADCETIVMKPEAGNLPMFWRFYAVSDQDMECVIIRDCDSRVNFREQMAVDAWLESGKTLHLMHDYPPPHATEIILGGMWGIRGGAIKNMPELVKSWTQTHNYHIWCADMLFLNEVIWPMFRGDYLSHGVDFRDGKGVPFPPHKPMRFGEYVGQVIEV